MCYIPFDDYDVKYYGVLFSLVRAWYLVEFPSLNNKHGINFRKPNNKINTPSIKD